ncbi:MAG TPA: Hsp70 family protein [Polyangiales bacterium]|nr:Hsp70 family protein [Polyangiales bacterium]
MRLGVDFGTTHTVVAYADRGNYPVLSFADEAGDFHDFFPSVVAELGGELRFGFEALALAREPGATLLRSFKRLLSDPRAAPSRPVHVGATALPLAELLSQFLAALREAMLTRSNLDAAHKHDRDEGLRCVIGVPAHGHGAQRFITLDAFRRAGFEPMAMLNEPSAAGFEFTHRHRASLTARREHVVVYDLGGGTFDASLVRIRGTHHEILDTNGLNWVGGDEFDAALLELVLTRAELARSELAEAALTRLLDQCRDAKERVSPSSRKLSIDLEGALGELAPTPELVISVDDYYDACTPLLDKTLEAMTPVLDSLERALAGDPKAGDGLAGIYVVGGASALPLVTRVVRKRFGRRVHKSPYPSAAVAIGLAIGADESAEFALSDHFSRTFGVFREGAAGDEITFDPIFTRDTNVPAHNGGRRITCRRSYRAAHNVGHFRFLECSAIGDDGRPTGDGILSGDVLFPFDPALCSPSQDLSSVPVRRSDQSPQIEEEYTLDEHGIVAVTIRNLDADYQRIFHLGR